MCRGGGAQLREHAKPQQCLSHKPLLATLDTSFSVFSSPDRISSHVHKSMQFTCPGPDVASCPPVNRVRKVGKLRAGNLLPGNYRQRIADDLVRKRVVRVGWFVFRDWLRVIAAQRKSNDNEYANVPLFLRGWTIKTMFAHLILTMNIMNIPYCWNCLLE